MNVYEHARFHCDECNEFGRCIQVGQHEDGTACLCARCLEKALTMLRSVVQQPEKP